MTKSKKKQPSQPQTKISPERYMREHVRKLPIDKCWVSEDWQDEGLAVVIITRKKKNGHYAVGSFLVDTYCLGVKDAGYWVDLDQDDVEELLRRYSHSVKMIEASYAEVHNLILGAIEFAEEAGIEPHKDFAVAGYILEEDTDDIPLIEYEYGKDGKYLLIVGPTWQETRFITTLQQRLGDKFGYVLPDDDDDYQYDDEYDEDWEDDEFDNEDDVEYGTYDDDKPE